MTLRILVGDCRQRLSELPDGSVDSVVTSPPYFGLRDYGMHGQIGLENNPQAFVEELVSVFREVRRVLKPEGTLWLNLGDTYNSGGRGGHPGDKTTLGGGTTRHAEASKARRRPCPQGKTGQRSDRANHMAFKAPPANDLKPKDLLGIPWRVAFALQADGWYLRQDIIWHKPNPMPESVTDRCTKAHEYIFLLSKSERYFYDADAIAEPSVWYGVDARSDKGNIRYEGKRTIDKSGKNGQEGFAVVTENRNKRSVWTVTTKPYEGAHFATYPTDLIEPCIKAGCPRGGVVLDPFFGAGTTGIVADRLGRNCIGIELNPAYADMARGRFESDAGMFAEVGES